MHVGLILTLQSDLLEEVLEQEECVCHKVSATTGMIHTSRLWSLWSLNMQNNQTSEKMQYLPKQTPVDENIKNRHLCEYHFYG
jgi:hypothetical protein